MTDKICWITGASSGIGEELAKHLAKDGWTVAASARSQDKLINLASLSYGNGKIVSYPLDVKDLAAVKRTVETLTSQLGTVTLAILCAGTYIPDSAAHFRSETIRSQLDLNVMGVAHALEALLPVMKHQEHAHIAIVASVAGYRGLPYATGYGATKAALINMTESLRPECKELGIKLQLICPGFVKTPLTDKNEFPMPFLISADQAAATIMKGLKQNCFEFVFPWKMKLSMKILSFLPHKIFFALTRKMLKQNKD